ncbi:MAG TPA: hypothetical protein PKD64_12795 [Pirellulaceae bacterium]|nr:hypothetical protein [Pirellulaceae bacterium]HMO93065.1 hypothetical protein [Pirellulaceae bacterium]HMP69696.1 hypothetical protein [Pirellulaceae bacterium]
MFENSRWQGLVQCAFTETLSLRMPAQIRRASPTLILVVGSWNHNYRAALTKAYYLQKP